MTTLDDAITALNAAVTTLNTTANTGYAQAVASAITQANTATTQAGIATTKAGEASSSAIAAAASAASINPNNIDINGGTVDGAVIGGAVPAAGSFTTINSSSTPTFTTNTGYIGMAGAGTGGNWRYIDDSGSARWLTGLLGGAGATRFSLYDIANSKEVLSFTPNAAAVAITFTGLSVTGGISATGEITVGSFTVATRPAHAAGKIIHVTDGGTGAVYQASAGGAWVNLG